MKYFMLLTTTCVDDIKSCCSDYGIATYLHIIKEAMNLIRFIVAAILIIMLAIDFAKMVINPVDNPNKDKFKSIRNKILSAVIVFFVPTIVSVLLGAIPDSVSDIYGCWNAADEIYDTMKEKASTTTSKKNGSTNKVKDNKDYSTKEYNRHYSYTDPSSSSSSSNTNANGQEIANYAKEFVGNKYVYGGTWNGEKPYTPTDCSGFVQGVYRHFGITLPRTCTPQSKQGTAVSSISEAKPGDLFFYGKNGANGDKEHVSMYIGNNQVVHASGRKDGIKISSANYRTPASIRRYVS